MALALTNNVSSITAQDNLNRTSASLNKSLERLSSGLKVNRGADGPAALVISEQQRAQITGIQTAIDNTSKAVSLVQTGEGALNEINSLLNKVRGLALDSANSGVHDSKSLQANQDEISNAVNTITQIAKNTQFGTKKLLDGSAATTAVVNTNPANLSSVDASSATVGNYTVNVTQAGVKSNVTAASAASTLVANETLTIAGGGLSSNINVALTAGDTVGSQLTKLQSALDAGAGAGTYSASLNTSGRIQITRGQFGSTSSNLSVTSDAAAGTSFTGFGSNAAHAAVAADTAVAGANLQGTITRPDGTTSATISGTGTSGSSITDAASGISVNIANAAGSSTSTVAAASSSTVTVAGAALTFQIGANANQTASISFQDSRATALGKNVTNNSGFTDLSQIDVTTQQKAQDSIKVIDQAISDISGFRGKIGAFQANTLESTARNLRTTLENTTAAESTIRDTDFASETAQFTKNQVLMQAGTTVLQNANQTSQLVLGLLRG